MKHFLSINDLSKHQLDSIIQLALAGKQQHWKNTQPLQGLHVAMLFEKPSLRTKASFEVGLAKLGAQVSFYDMQSSKIGQRESTADLAANLSQWYDAIVARVDEHQCLHELAKHASIPVINALCDQHHPCQALADVMTLTELADEKQVGVNQRKHAYIGDYNNVAQSLAQACSIANIPLTLVTPIISSVAMKKHSNVEVIDSHDFLCNLEDYQFDVVYTDVWQSMGQEQNDTSALAQLQLNHQLLNAIGHPQVLHCQPIHHDEEISSQVALENQRTILQQAQNRMHAQNAMMIWLLGAKNEKCLQPQAAVSSQKSMTPINQVANAV